MKHLDGVAGHSGRKSHKILCDLRFLMEYIKEQVRLVGRWNSSHTVESIIDMYDAVVDDYLVIRDDGPSGHDRRDVVLKWQTLVGFIRRRVQRKREKCT